MADRIEPFEGERSFPDPTIEWRRRWRVTDALDLMEGARRDIQSCEFRLALVRGRMDGIAADAISREEMKPWLREHR